MNRFLMVLLSVLVFPAFLSANSRKGDITIRVEVVRFQEDALHIELMDGTDSWISEIELRVVSPKEFSGIYLVEQWGGYQAGGDFTTVGNLFEASADPWIFDKRNIDENGKILCYTLPYRGLEQFKLVRSSQPDKEKNALGISH